MPRYTFHLIGNSHLDPVWMWDWREGLNEGLTTVRTMLTLMDEFPEMTYSRGESLIYEHIEREDPVSFARIREHVRNGRWDPIGGGYLQPDTNMPATETFARNYLLGQRYFAEKFGKPATAAWAADSFGHAAGLPEIMAGAGFRDFAFCRPFAEQMALPGPAFWWEGSAGSRILGYRAFSHWYGCERTELPKRFDLLAGAAVKQPFQNIAVFYGLGNHGGGPTRQTLLQIREWAAAHPEVAVVHSGLHRFFAALRREIASRPEAQPGVHRGELGYCQRGCYVSAGRFKYAFRHAEAALSRAETAGVAVEAVTRAPAPDLGKEWRGLVFNSFHDILPGSSIERALDEQIDWTRGLSHTARTLEFNALNALARQVDTTVPPVKGDHPTVVPYLVWNPHPHAYNGPLEIEGCLDYRPIWSHEKKHDEVLMEVRGPNGKLQPFQKIAPEHLFSLPLPWRWRVITPVNLPPLSWSVFTFGWVQQTKRSQLTGGPSVPRKGEITNGLYHLKARIGGKGIGMFAGKKSIFSDAGFGAITVEDSFGSWGNAYDEPEGMHLMKVRHIWKITAVETMEVGPMRASLWVQLKAGNSELSLIFRLARDRNAIDVEARLLWNESRARLKLVFPGVGERAEFEVTGGVVTRGPSGEVPGGRWVRATNGRQSFGFASDALYGFDTSDDTLRASVLRTSRYAFDARDTEATPPWVPVADRGEYKFRFLLTTDVDALPRLAKELEQPLNVLMVPPHPGKLRRQGSIASITPGNVHLIALKKSEDGKAVVVRLQETAGKRTAVRFTLAGKTYRLGTLAPHALGTWRLTRTSAEPVAISELPSRGK